MNITSAENNLQAACVRCIGMHFDKLNIEFNSTADEQFHHCVRLVQKLYCDQILKILSEQKTLTNKHLKFLINKYTRQLDLNSLLYCDLFAIEDRLQDVGSVIVHFSMAGIKRFESCDLLLQHLTALQNLDLSRTNCSDSSLRVLSENCTQLKTLFLYGCDQVTDKGLLDLCQKHPPLETLNVEYTSVSYKGVAFALEVLPSLSYLWYDNVPKAIIEASGLHNPSDVDISRTYSLKNIVILNNPRRPEHYLTAVLNVCSKTCPCIRDLIVSEMVNEEQLVLCSTFGELENVSLLCSLYVSPKLNVCNFIEAQGYKLSSLSLVSFTVSIELIARCCPNLKSLCLQYPTFEDIRESSLDFSSLVRLSLQNATLDFGSSTYMVTSSPNLEELHIVHCQLSDEMQEVILQMPPQLRVLNLSNTEVSSYFVEEVLRVHKRLERLVIDNSGITSEEYDDIMDIVDESKGKVRVVWADYSEAIRELFCMDYDTVFNNPQKRIILKL